jgi:hypothetical protein
MLHKVGKNRKSQDFYGYYGRLVGIRVVGKNIG